jgi:hypothetical protein
LRRLAFVTTAVAMASARNPWAVANAASYIGPCMTCWNNTVSYRPKVGQHWNLRIALILYVVDPMQNIGRTRVPQ